MTKPGSQNDRILAILADGAWHSAKNLERRTGARRLNSRISELRKRGHGIESETTTRSGSLGYRYRLLGRYELVDHRPVVPDDEFTIPNDVIMPRDALNRFHIFRMVYDELHPVATATTPEDVGCAIVTLGLEGEFAQSALGILDTHGTDEKPGTWVINPFDTVPLKGER